MTETKTCRRCRASKPAADFTYCPVGEFGTCKRCVADKTKAWSAANPERKKANARRQHEQRPDVHKRNKKITNWARTLLQAAKTSSRTRRHDPPSITEEWILAQPMRCPYLGVELTPQIRNRALDQPSLDRIDCDKGYTPENTRLTSLAWNLMRSNAPVEEALSLVARIRLTVLLREVA